METEELSTHFHAATTDVSPRPEFVEAVVAGGRRRQVRRRAGIATAAALVVALAGGATYAVVANDTVTAAEVMAGWLDEPTKGDLAGDQQFLDVATRAWETGRTASPNESAGVFDDLRGPAHVYWAGNTGDGRAAVVVQQAYLHPHEGLPPGAADTVQTLVGLVATDQDDGKLTLVGDQFQASPGDPLPGYFWFGENDRTLLVVDTRQPVWERVEVVQPGEGGGAEWHRLPLVDGVGLVTTEPGLITPPLSIGTAVIGPDPTAHGAVVLPTYLASDYRWAVTSGSPLAPAVTPGLGWGENWVVGPDVDFPINDPLALYKSSVGPGRLVDDWTIRLRFPGGGAMFVGLVKDGPTPWRVIVTVTNQQGEQMWSFGVGSVHPGSLVPIIAPVYHDITGGGPDGFVVADKGQPLSYRTNGDWVDAGTSVALVPADTEQVKVGDRITDIPRP